LSQATQCFCFESTERSFTATRAQIVQFISGLFQTLLLISNTPLCSNQPISMLEGCDHNDIDVGNSALSLSPITKLNMQFGSERPGSVDRAFSMGSIGFCHCLAALPPIPCTSRPSTIQSFYLVSGVESLNVEGLITERTGIGPFSLATHGGHMENWSLTLPWKVPYRHPPEMYQDPATRTRLPRAMYSSVVKLEWNVSSAHIHTLPVPRTVEFLMRPTARIAGWYYR
jgi:hypothetical protein